MVASAIRRSGLGSQALAFFPPKTRPALTAVTTASEEGAVRIAQGVVGGKRALVTAAHIYQSDLGDEFAHSAGKSVEIAGNLKRDYSTLAWLEFLK